MLSRDAKTAGCFGEAETLVRKENCHQVECWQGTDNWCRKCDASLVRNGTGQRRSHCISSL